MVKKISNLPGSKKKANPTKAAEEANILSETKNSTTIVDKDEVITATTESEIKESKATHSTIVDFEDDKNIKKEAKVKVNFMDDKYTDDFINKGTKQAVFNETTTTAENITAEDIRKEEEKLPSLGYTDFLVFAEFIMEVIDMSVSTGLRFYAKDTSYTAYELPKPRMDKLSKMLALIMVKYQARLKIEIIFLVSLVAAYSGPFIKAKNNRKIALGRVNVLETKTDTGKRKQGNPEK